ncbi:hypothetical protein [Nostoc sp. WHI]|uniref:hypothetical protein n=1 Tax=Nostoc sp. WHI TaxID=2650611 RepID=UPI0018C70FF5|nr:hypothetical protein [Nostoc sp. WHI]MBG1270944.1 hypothetical protein [Nostoc sp. WHI]
MVILFNLQQQLWTYHFTWNEDATKIVGIISVGRATILALKMNRLQLIRVPMPKMWLKMGKT